MLTQKSTATQRKKSRAVAHHVGGSAGKKAHSSVTQRMMGGGYSISGLISWGSRKLQDAKRDIEHLLLSGRSIADIAEATGFGVLTIQGLLSDPNPDEELVNELISGIRKNFKYSYDTNPMLFAVPGSLINDLPDGEQEKVDEIFRRINNYPFTYTGKSGDGLTSFLKKSGDCSDLAEMFIYAVKAAGIFNIQLEDRRGYMLVEEGLTHGYGDATCNTEGESWWIFQDHFWCNYNGIYYDLLFRQKGYPQMTMKSGFSDYRDINYDYYPNGRCVIPPWYFQKLNIPVVGRPQGMVFASFNEMCDFIDARLGDVVINLNNNNQQENQ